MVACRRMYLRPKFLLLDRGYIHPSLEATVWVGTHVQGEEVDEGRRSNLCLPIAASCSSICHLSHGRLVPHAPCSSPRLLKRFSGCLADDKEGRIRSDGYSARNLETIGIDLSNLCLPIAASCSSICHLSHGRLIPHAPCSSSPRLLKRFSGCLADDREGRIRSDGYSARNLETIGIDLLYKPCVARDVEPASGKKRWIM
ncbi:hypothetical protein ACQJBY_005578 [Aegilops geniculata]